MEEDKTGRSPTEKKNGQKWQDMNYKAKKAAQEQNGGQLPYSPALETSYHPLSRNWSAEHLPEVLFYLVPPESKYKGQAVEYLKDDETGKTALSEEGDEIRDFEILPRYISIEVEGWMIEAWRRLDCRIGYEDIRHRQRSDPDFGNGIGLKKVTKNAMSNHCRRDCRKTLNSWVEYGRRDEPHRTEVESIEELCYENIVYNTVLSPSEDYPGRLVRLRFVQKSEDGLWYTEPLDVTAANVCQTTFDIHHFKSAALPALSTDNCMTKWMGAAWEMSILLQERAEKHGKQHWSKLSRQCLPVSWFDRLKEAQRTVPNMTYDGGCTVCTWVEGESDHVGSSKKRKSQTFITPQKRGWVASDANSDEPLMKKYKSVQVSEVDTDSDYESEEDETFDSAPPGTRRRDSDAESSTSFLTPARTGRKARKGKDEHDAGLEDSDVDDDATQGMLSSEGRSGGTSSRHRYAGYQTYSPLRHNLDSSLAHESTPPYTTDEIRYQPTAIRGSSSPWAQPTWLQNPTVQSQEWDKQQDLGSEATDYQDGFVPVNSRQISFTSDTTNLHSSFTSDGMHAVATAATSFDSGFNFQNVPYGPQQASTRIQQAFGLGQYPDFHPSQMSHYHPGRVTAQGARLSNSFSSPPPMTGQSLDSTAFMYPPGTFASGIDPRRRSFGSHSFADAPIPSYGNSFAMEESWNGGGFVFQEDDSALPGVDPSTNEDYENLPAATHASMIQPQAKPTTFGDLLSSDPVLPEEYQDHAYGPMADENQYNGAQLEYEAGAYETVNHAAPARIARKTPPYLEV